MSAVVTGGVELGEQPPPQPLNRMARLHERDCAKTRVLNAFFANN